MKQTLPAITMTLALAAPLLAEATPFEDLEVTIQVIDDNDISDIINAIELPIPELESAALRALPHANSSVEAAEHGAIGGDLQENAEVASSSALTEISDQASSEPATTLVEETATAIESTNSGSVVVESATDTAASDTALELNNSATTDANESINSATAVAVELSATTAAESANSAAPENSDAIEQSDSGNSAESEREHAEHSDH